MTKKIAVLILALLLTLSAIGCSSEKSVDNQKEIVSEKCDEDFTSTLNSNKDFESVFEDDKCVLYLKGSTTEIAVKDKSSGKMWYSQPVDRASDKVATGNYAVALNAPFSFLYMDKSNKPVTVNCYDKSVQLGQFGYKKLKNGIKVYYRVGESVKNWLVPMVVTAKRMDEICSKLSEADAETLKMYYLFLSLDDADDDSEKATYITQYPAIKSGDIYVMGGINLGHLSYPDYLLEQIEGYFKQAGYTEAQMKKDNEENQIQNNDDKDYSISFSVEYTVDDGDLVVNIPVKEISYDETVMTVTEMSVLPFFGAARADKNGYMLVPDGCGAVINLNSAQSKMPSYKKSIYGADKTLATKEKDSSDLSQIYLPVFGIKADNQGFLAIVENGDANGDINAEPAGKLTSYNQIYSSFCLRDSMQQNSSIMNVSGNRVYQKGNFTYDIRLRYKLLADDDSTYVGMANAYASYLDKKGIISKQTDSSERPFHLSMIGAVTYTHNVLGIPVESEKCLTGYKQAIAVLKELKNGGADDIAFSFSGWANGGVNGTVFNDINLVPALGTKKDFSDLVEYIKKESISFYPEVELQYVSKYKKGFNVNKNAVRDLSNMVVYDWNYNFATLLRDDKSKKAVISPSYFDKMTVGISKKIRKLNLGNVMLSSIGQDLSSDFDENETYYRQESLQKIVSQIEKLKSDNISVATAGANAYALKGASFVSEVPSHSSGNYLFDRDVPFYQIVMRGYVSCASEPLNMAGNYNTEVLKLVETGMLPTFRLIFESNLELKDTDTSYYSINYSSWKEDALKLYGEISNLVPNNSRIVFHDEPYEKLTVTKFENGTAVYVNYGDADRIYNGVKIKSGDYTVVKGEKKYE